MKYSLALLALTLATFTSALPHPGTSAIDRRGGNGDPYAPHGGTWSPNPYTNNKSGSGYEHGENQSKADDGNPYDNNKTGSAYEHGEKKRSPVPHRHYDEDYDQQQQDQIYQDELDDKRYWRNVGNEYPKRST